VNLWIEIPLWLLGLCIGSFLNVVIYRLPAGLSIAQPPRSFCPHCRSPIAARDNIPVLSWIFLRGRCRSCRAPISVQYPLVEALTGLAFVVTYHLLFVERARLGLESPNVATDFWLLLSWLVLVAVLIACSVMDIVSYTIDVRLTDAAVGVGVFCHACWPRPSFFETGAESPLAACATAAFLAALIMLWRTSWKDSAGPEEGADPIAAPGGQPPAAVSRGARVGGIIGVVLAIVVTAGLFVLSTERTAFDPELRPAVVAGAFLTTFAAIVCAGGLRRPADEELAAAITTEQPAARKVALGELAWLAPSLLAGVIVGMWLAGAPGAASAWYSWMNWSPVGDIRPLSGAAFAMTGAVLAAAAGWALRIVFTLALGREAFGVGDICILAAAGAAAGWDIALLGLILSVGVALVGWVLGLLLKATAMIPFGPWLALGFLLALWLDRPASAVTSRYADAIRELWRANPAFLALALGIMLVSAAAALLVARVIRRRFER
jgi:leader peptidase (prepilin peptidase)/N-methyltransferase